MRLTASLLLLACLQANAKGYSQITLSEHNIPLHKVFKKIHKQSGVDFFYDYELLRNAGNVTVNVKNVPLKHAIEAAIKGNSLTYEIINNTVVIRRRLEPVSEKKEIPVAIGEIEGRVTDEAGNPLQGATVRWKGKESAATTDENGSFSLRVPEGGGILVISYIGYESYEVRVSKEGDIKVNLKRAESKAEEVVVMGYGTQKKENLTGAVSVVKGSELVNRPTSTVSQALQGRVPGMNFTAGNYGFEPGAGLNIQVRGQGTPLILVDGIYTTSLNGLNPNDIESVSVLKDAAATAIYGARAPYGVVLITTKSGASNNKLNIEYSGSYSSIKPIRMPHHLDSYTTALALNEAAANSGLTPLFTNATIDRILAYKADPTLPETVPSAANPALWANTFESNANYDWFDVFYGKGNRYQHNVSVSGGSKNLTFYISGGYINDGGVLQLGTDNYRRYNTTAKFNANITKWMKVTSNTRYFNTSRNTPAYDNQGNYDLLFHQVARTFPSQFMRSPHGVYSIQSKIPWTKDAGNENTTINDVVQRFAAEITPLNGLTINADYTFQITSNQFTSKNFTVFEDNVAGSPVISGSTAPASVAKSQALTFYNTFNTYASYNLKHKNHQATVMTGYQQEKSNYTYLFASRTGLITPAVPAINTSTGVVNGTDNLSEYATEGLFARFNYSFDGRYLLEFNGRYDGTYKFADGKKWGFFPSMSAGWNISNEKFWESLSGTVNALKLRGSWGSLGNQLTAQAYQDISLLGVNANLPWIISGTRPSFTSAPTLVNPDVTWETSRTKNLGLDAGVLNNRITLTAEVYQRMSINQLGPSVAVPAVIGVSTLPQSNNMETKTSGWELALNWNDRIGKDFRFSLGAQLFDYQTTILKYNNPTRILTNPYSGQKVGEIWGFVSDGLILDQATADQVNTGQTQKAISGQTWKTGDMRYVDLNKDGSVNYGANTADDPGDRRVIGNSTPRYQYGITLRAEWKGFDLSVFWQGVGKRDLMLGDNFFWGFTAPIQSSVFSQHLNYYRDADADKYKGLGKNTDAYFARPYLDPSMNSKNQVTQSRFLQSAAYARLKNVQIGYSLPKALLDRIRMRSIYLYVSGENLLTITKLSGQFDPENANLGVRGPGKSFFPQQAITFGANLKF